jgi:hypothetical protein
MIPKFITQLGKARMTMTNGAHALPARVQTSFNVDDRLDFCKQIASEEGDF